MLSGFAKAAPRMTELSPDSPEQRVGRGGPIGFSRSRLAQAGHGQQGEGLIIEIGFVIQRLAAGADQRSVEPVRSPIAPFEIAPAVLGRLQPRARQAQGGGLGVDEGLAGLDSSAPWPGRGDTVLLQHLMEPALGVVGAQRPPDGQGRRPEPLFVTFEPGQEIDRALLRPQGATGRGLGRRLHPLAGIEAADQQGLGVGDHRQSIDAHKGDLQPACAAHQALARLLQQHLGVGRIARLVLGRSGPHRVPRPKVGPGERDRQHRSPIGALHHRVVE